MWARSCLRTTARALATRFFSAVSISMSWRRRCQIGKQLGEARLGVRDGEPSHRTLRYIQLRFRHVDANKDTRLSHKNPPWWPGLARYGLGSPRNCAGSSGDERDDPRCPTVSATSATTVYYAQGECLPEHGPVRRKIQGHPAAREVGVEGQDNGAAVNPPISAAGDFEDDQLIAFHGNVAAREIIGPEDVFRFHVARTAEQCRAAFGVDRGHPLKLGPLVVDGGSEPT